MTELPEPGSFVNIRSSRGATTYWNVEVLGVGDSPRGRALWCVLPGPDPLRPTLVQAYLPIAEVASWELARRG